MRVEIKRGTGGQLELKITVPRERVKNERDNILSQETKKVAIPGFRRGHAPKNLAQEKIDAGEIQRRLAEKLIIDAYETAVKEHHLRPITRPHIKILDFSPEGEIDFVFKAVTAEKPPVNLANYKEIAKRIGAEKKMIFGPDGKPIRGSKTPLMIDEIVRSIVKETKVMVAPILVEEEANRMLARLIDQIARLGLTVEQYLEAQGKSAEDLKREYQQQAEEAIKTELVLDEIAQKENILVSEEEVKRLIETSPDEKARKELAKEENRWYIRNVIRRRKVLEFLQKISDEQKGK